MAIYFSRCDARRVVRVVGRANQCLPLTTTCVTTVYTDLLLLWYHTLRPHPPTTGAACQGPQSTIRSIGQRSMPQSWRLQISICDGVAAMAIAGVALAARVAALGEGVGRIERRISSMKREARNGRHLARASFFHREIASRWEKSCPKSPRCS